MSRKSSKILLILVTILSLISTFSFATDATPVTTSEDAATLSVEKPEATEGTESENAENTTTEGETEGTTEDATTSVQPKEVNNDQYLIGDEITLSDTINGNAFIIAETLTITGQIGGDLFVMADTINLDGGQVYGNVFAIGKTITLNGLIYDLYAICDTLNVSYDGVAYRDLKVNCDTATINGVVGKNVNIAATKGLTLEADCVVYGDLNYSAPHEIEVAEGMVTGTTNYEKINAVEATDFFTILLDVVYVLIIWLLISKFAPKFAGKVTGLAPKKLLISPVVGLVSFILAILIPMILIITVVGIPVAFVLMVGYGLVIALGSAIFTIALAYMLANKVKVLSKLNNTPAVCVVALVLSLTTLIPFIGEWLAVLYTLIGIGIFLMCAFNKKCKKAEEAPVQE